MSSALGGASGPYKSRRLPPNRDATEKSGRCALLKFAESGLQAGVHTWLQAAKKLGRAGAGAGGLAQGHVGEMGETPLRAPAGFPRTLP